MPSRNLIRSIEELSINALPSLYTQLYDGWVLRLSDGLTRRANSINPLYTGSLPLDEKITYCEDLFRRRDRAPVFKMTPVTKPTLIDALTAHGYKLDAGTSLQTLRLGSSDGWIAFKSDLFKMTFTNRVTTAWIDDQIAFHEPGERARLTTRAAYELIIPHAAYFRLAFDGVPVAASLGVIERGWMGLYGIVVDEKMRGRGIGTELVRRMLGYGAAFNVTHAYLQVFTSNAPAIRLYNKIGFEEVYQYRYFQKQAGS